MKLKRLIQTTLALVFLSTAAFAQASNDLAKVSKVNGVPVYIFSDPINEYEILFSKGTGAKASSIMSDGTVNEGISDKVAQFVTRIQRQARRKGVEFDAILYTGGKQAAAIKFKEGTFQEANRDLARVYPVNGVHVFAMSEPVNNYEIVANKSGGAKVGSFLTDGLANKSIAGDISQFVRRLKRQASKENVYIQGMVYNAGKRAVGIVFE